MNYEQKYIEAVKKVKNEILSDLTRDSWVRAKIYEIFPELAESEDERIRKEIVDFITSSNKYGTNERCEAWLNWLEKQGEQKPADKVEPKFKVGDWVVYCGKPYQITGLRNDTFTLTSCDGSYFFNNVKSTKEPVFHLWTIEDAKDGDVLVDEDNNIGLYSGEKDDLYWHSCVYLGCDGYLRIVGGYHNHKNTKPATKEQRDLLFTKIKEAEYELDAEKKEVKKITTSPCSGCNHKSCAAYVDGDHRDTDTPKILYSDKVIEWIKTHGNLWPVVTKDIYKVIAKFKEDFEI